MRATGEGRPTTYSIRPQRHASDRMAGGHLRQRPRQLIERLDRHEVSSSATPPAAASHPLHQQPRRHLRGQGPATGGAPHAVAVVARARILSRRVRIPPGTGSSHRAPPARAAACRRGVIPAGRTRRARKRERCRCCDRESYERTDQDRSLCLLMSVLGGTAANNALSQSMSDSRHRTSVLPGRNRGVQVAVCMLRRLRSHDAAQSFHNGRPWRRAGAPPLHATRGSLQILVVADVQREAVQEPH
jgi:hypothetical protein